MNVVAAAVARRDNLSNQADGAVRSSNREYANFELRASKHRDALADLKDTAERVNS